mgnify:CR=1 FL=1
MDLIFVSIATLLTLIGLYVMQTVHTDPLYKLLLKINFRYNEEVVSGEKSYIRFVRDFCYECRFIDISRNVSIKEVNRQNRDIQFVCELLQTRQDLVEKYFREKYLAMENYRQLTMEFNVGISVESINVMEGTSDISRSQEKSLASINEKTTVLSVTSTSSPKKQKSFRHKFTSPQIELLVACINEISLFESKVSIAELTSLFDCTSVSTLKLTNNEMLCYLFNQLSLNEYIIRQWQAVIEQKQIFYSSGRNEYVTASDLSSALRNVNRKKHSQLGKEYQIIDNCVKNLKNS